MKKQQNSKFQKLIDNGNLFIDENIQLIKSAYINFQNFTFKNPYARLMRLHQPIGIQLVVLPVLWTLTIISYDIIHFLCLTIIFIFGAVIMRSAGSIVNDIIDKDIDKNVKRTKIRPLANGELTIKQGYKLLAILLIIALMILIILPLKSIYFGFLALFLTVIYPFIKRYSYYPQIFLGFTFNIGVFIAWYSVKNHISFIPILIYLSAVLWTIVYDTIYAHQDKINDIKIGVKSTALKFNNKTKITLNYVYKILIATLALTGLNSNLNIIYFAILFIVLFLSLKKLDNINLNSPDECNQNFKTHFDYGVLILIGFIIGHI